MVNASFDLVRDNNGVIIGTHSNNDNVNRNYDIIDPNNATITADLVEYRESIDRTPYIRGFLDKLLIPYPIGTTIDWENKNKLFSDIINAAANIAICTVASALAKKFIPIKYQTISGFIFKPVSFYNTLGLIETFSYVALSHIAKKSYYKLFHNRYYILEYIEYFDRISTEYYLFYLISKSEYMSYINMTNNWIYTAFAQAWWHN